jgi:membrane-associated phospholipid phosphatase
MPEKPWVSRLLLVMAALIAVATVYGRYHYAVDALAGLLVAAGVWAAAAAWDRRQCAESGRNAVRPAESSVTEPARSESHE